MTKDEFLYYANHDWKREAQIRREIAREVYFANPAHNTVLALLGVLVVIALTCIGIVWSADDNRVERYRRGR